ncbi:MAG: class I SAM-dependent methyltransferase [Gammaproteobacteria bacterium]|nr:class I SAM-dependent methyltransferase [Gammaproteobacteria bacterium]
MILDHNRDAWDRQVDEGNEWTVPVTAEQVSEARNGNVRIVLTPSIIVPGEWFPSLRGAKVLCLASGGGQQGPLLAAAGADVTVFDNSPKQLGRDREVAERERLELSTVQGDMRDLSVFESDTFDLIVHPVSNTFVPDVRPVWREAYRVLKPGACLLSGFDNPVIHLFDETEYDNGNLVVTNRIPYSDTELLSTTEISQRAVEGRPLEFGHTLDHQIGGQLEAGFTITGFYEDRYPGDDPLSKYIAMFIATRALKGM